MAHGWLFFLMCESVCVDGLLDRRHTGLFRDSARVVHNRLGIKIRLSLHHSVSASVWSGRNTEVDNRLSLGVKSKLQSSEIQSSRQMKILPLSILLQCYPSHCPSGGNNCSSVTEWNKYH